jgi:hypothetical protein
MIADSVMMHSRDLIEMACEKGMLQWRSTHALGYLVGMYALEICAF